MANSYFQFKQFTIHQDRCAMKVTTDSCLFGAWIAAQVRNNNNEVRTLLDMGTGTGLLSLMLAQSDPAIQIDAVEIDKQAAEQAAENIAQSPFTDRIKVYQADAKEFLPDNQYGIIISNPPFYENELRSENSSKNIAHHSDELLLNDVLLIIKKNLKPGGLFCLLLPYKRNKEVKDLLIEHGFTLIKMTYVRQSTTHDHFRIMLMGKIKEEGNNYVYTTDELSVCDNDQQYTTAFIELLKDYYLHL